MIRLQEQPFEVLQTMLERPGDVVTREEFRQRLWPSGTFVDFEHGLNAAVKRLRAALAALHEMGQPHGAIDSEHVFIDEAGAVVLAWAPPPGPTTTFDVDRLALAALS